MIDQLHRDLATALGLLLESSMGALTDGGRQAVILDPNYAKDASIAQRLLARFAASSGAAVGPAITGRISMIRRLNDQAFFRFVATEPYPHATDIFIDTQGDPFRRLAGELAAQEIAHRGAQVTLRPFLANGRLNVRVDQLDRELTYTRTASRPAAARELVNQ